MENMDKGEGTRCTKMCADSLAGNTPKCICPSPKVLDFNEKRLHWASLSVDWGIPGIEIKDKHML